MVCFFGCKKFNSDISNWNVSNVKSMHQTFIYNYKFNIDISSWDVSNVTCLVETFNQCISFNQNLDSWKINRNCNYRWAFAGCNSLKYKPFWYKKY